MDKEHIKMLEFCRVKHYFVRKENPNDYAGRSVVDGSGNKIGKVLDVVKDGKLEFLKVSIDFPILLCNLDDSVPISHVAFAADA